MDTKQVAVVSSVMVLVAVFPWEETPPISQNTVGAGVILLDTTHSKSRDTPSVMYGVVSAPSVTYRVRSDEVGATETTNKHYK